MKKWLFLVVAAFAICVAVACVSSSSLGENVKNSLYAAMLIWGSVITLGVCVYSSENDGVSKIS